MVVVTSEERVSKRLAKLQTLGIHTNKLRAFLTTLCTVIGMP